MTEGDRLRRGADLECVDERGAGVRRRYDVSQQEDDERYGRDDRRRHDAQAHVGPTRRELAHEQARRVGVQKLFEPATCPTFDLVVAFRIDAARNVI